MQKQTRYRPPYRTCVTKINLNTIAEESADSQDEPMESFIFQTSEIDDYYQSAAKIAEAIGLRKTLAKRDLVKPNQKPLNYLALQEPLRSKIKALISTVHGNGLTDYHTFVSVVAVAAQKKQINLSEATKKTLVSKICGHLMRNAATPRTCSSDKKVVCSSRNGMLRRVPLVQFTCNGSIRNRKEICKDIEGAIKRATTGFSLHSSFHENQKR
jgi:hypothetical protein